MIISREDKIKKIMDAITVTESSGGTPGGSVGGPGGSMVTYTEFSRKVDPKALAALLVDEILVFTDEKYANQGS